MKNLGRMVLTIVTLVCLVGVAGAVLPSGPGQTDMAHSKSVVVASDQVVPAASPDHSTDATFTLAVWVTNNGSANVTGVPATANVLLTENDPNTTSPAAARVVRVTAKRGGTQFMGGGFWRGFTNGVGTSIVVQPWYFDDTLATWIKFGPAVTITNSTTNLTAAVTMGNMAGAKFFLQITTVTGATALGYDYQ